MKLEEYWEERENTREEKKMSFKRHAGRVWKCIFLKRRAGCQEKKKARHGWSELLLYFYFSFFLAFAASRGSSAKLIHVYRYLCAINLPFLVARLPLGCLGILAPVELNKNNMHNLNAILKLLFVLIQEEHAFKAVDWKTHSHGWLKYIYIYIYIYRSEVKYGFRYVG